MALSNADATQVLKDLVPVITADFYDGKKFTVFDGIYEVVPQLKVEVSSTPNGNLDPVSGNQMGVSVTSGLLNISDSTAIKFGLAHELGHGFSETLLTKIGMRGTSGCVTEVIADLGAAYGLTRIGVSWSDILQSVRDGVKVGIFDLGWGGDHPPGADRAKFVTTLSELMNGGESFPDAAKAICLSVQGYKG